MEFNLLLPSEELRRVAGKAPMRFLCCPNTELCKKQPACMWETHPTYRYMLKLTCNKCSCSWYVCTLCDRVQSYYKTLDQVYRHCSRANANHPGKKFLSDNIKKKQAIDLTLFNEDNSMITNNLGETEIYNQVIVTTTQQAVSRSVIACSDQQCMKIHQQHQNTNNDCSMDNNLFVDSDNDVAIPNLETYTDSLSDITYSNNQSARYFSYEQQGLGIQYLNSYSQYHSESQSDSIDLYDSETMLYLSYLVRSLTFNQRCHLTEVFKRVMLMNERRITNHQYYKNIPTTDVPTNYCDLRKYVLDGKYAIFDNLPHPTIYHESQHSYITLIDIVKDAFGHGLCFPDIEQFLPTCDEDYITNNHITTCKRTRRMHEHLLAENLHVYYSLNDIPFHLFAILWSDSFEPNYSIKSNRSSVHLITCTFLQPIAPKKEIVYTYPVAVSKSGTDHNNVFNLIHTQANNSRDSPIKIFSKYHKKIMPVTISVLASIHDQPERREILGLAGGNSTYHARFGYSMDVQYLSNKLRACAECYNSLRNDLESRIKNQASTIEATFQWKELSCKNCVCWTYVPGSSLLSFPPPPNYPLDYDQLENGHIQSKKLNFGILISIIKKVHSNIVTNIWSSKEAEAVLRTYCINSNTIDAIIDRSFNQKMIDNIMKEPNYATNEDYKQIIIDYQNNPEMYQQYIHPSTWKSKNDIQTFVEAPMHLLFLGIAKTIFIDINVWLSKISKYSTFLKNTTGILESVESLKLPWLKVLSYPKGKFGGWVAENFLALTRIQLWFYTILERISDDDNRAELPKTDQSTWLKKDNILWLKQRGLSTEGSALHLRNEVYRLMNQTEGPPPVIRNDVIQCEQVLELLKIFHMMIRCIMVAPLSSFNISDAQLLVRIFLSDYSEFTNRLYDNADVPKWISKYNFLSLLNLIDQMEDLGTPRELWEGGYLGEGYLRVVKPTIKNGMRGNWETNLMSNLMKDKALSTICNDVIKKSTQAVLSYEVYPSYQFVWQSLMKKEPVSCIINNRPDDLPEILVVYNLGQNVVYSEICIKHFVKEQNLLKYYKVCLLEENKVMDTIEANSNKETLIGAVILPDISTAGSSTLDLVYTIVDMNWIYYRI
jgi:hypothetical protein